MSIQGSHISPIHNNYNKANIHHLMPNDSDLSCQSELDLPELEPPSTVEEGVQGRGGGVQGGAPPPCRNEN